MPDAERSLRALTEARQQFKSFAAAVDADLALERTKRLAAEHGRIRSFIIDAHLGGASIADLKRAYGTKDYRTIRAVLDSAVAEIAERERIATEKKSDKFFWIEGKITIVESNDMVFDVIELEDGEYMLDGFHLPSYPDDEFYRWDGAVVDESSTGEHADLYQAILNRPGQ